MNKQKHISTETITLIAFFVLFGAILLVFQTLRPTFLQLGSITTMLKTGATTAIAALGLTFVIAVDHSDISFYMSSCFSGMFMAWLIQTGMNPFVAIAGGLIAGIVWGFISGYAVGKLKLPDKIATIAIGSIAFGCAYIFSDGAFIFENMRESGITNLSEYRIFGITVSVYIMIALYVIAYIILNRSTYGRNFYAVGANKKAAFFSGIKVNKYVIAAFIICGVLAALSAMISNASQGQGNVRSGINLLMPCFSAVYIGWSVFRRPHVIGTLLGSLLSTVITTGFTIMSVPYYYSDLVMAAVLIAAIGLSKIEFKPKDGAKRKKAEA